MSKFLNCIECGKPRKRPSKRERCAECYLKTVRKHPIYTHCVECGVEKVGRRFTRHPKCRDCYMNGENGVRKYPSYKQCISCGKEKTGQQCRQPRCKTCAQRKLQVDHISEAVLFNRCTSCGKEKITIGQRRSPLCISCSSKLRWQINPPVPRFPQEYPKCISCGKEKTTRMQRKRKLCIKCAAKKRVYIAARQTAEVKAHSIDCR